MSDIRTWKALITNALKENDVEDMVHQDHEVSMAKSQLLSSVKSATRIAKNLQDRSEQEGLEGWVASKLTMAEDYLQAVADHMDGQEINEGYKVLPPIDKDKYGEIDGLEGPFRTLNGHVVYYDPKEGSYYDKDKDMYISYDEFRQMDNDYSGMKDERDEVKEAGGYYTQPVYDMIKKHGYEKVMHELLTALDADEIQSFLQRANFDESVNEADETKYGIVRYPDTAISYIKNDGNGWEHIFDKSYGFEGPVDKEDLQYAKKIAKEKIPSRMFESTDTCECGCDCGKDVCESCGKKHSVNESSEMMTEAQFDEAAGEKDACYRKVKSRYKVWPSAYASGALVKCRKVGASNWGNSKK